MQALKVVLTGAFNSGKTQFIRTVSEIDVVSTEMVRQPEADDLSQAAATVAMDFGRLTVDADLALYLFGTPGPRRFDFMWSILGGEEFLGFVVMVDSANPETFQEAESIIKVFRAHAPAPYVVTANKQDSPYAASPEDLRIRLGIEQHVPIVPCIATDEESVKRVLVALCYEYLRWVDEDTSAQSKQNRP